MSSQVFWIRRFIGCRVNRSVRNDLSIVSVSQAVNLPALPENCISWSATEYGFRRGKTEVRRQGKMNQSQALKTRCRENRSQSGRKLTAADEDQNRSRCESGEDSKQTGFNLLIRRCLLGKSLSGCSEGKSPNWFTQRMFGNNITPLTSSEWIDLLMFPMDDKNITQMLMCE